jgi:hypothetical protein
VARKTTETFKLSNRAIGISGPSPHADGANDMPTIFPRRTVLLSIPLALAATAVSAGLFSQHLPDDLELALRRPTEAKLYIVEIAPVESEIRLGRMHAWTLALTDGRGRPVASAQIRIDGGMPQHGHGLPSAPAVTQALGDGRFLIEGMKFNMRGWWEIDVSIDGPAGADAITFNLVL